MSRNISVVGLDISKLSASAWLLTDIPNDPKRFARRYREVKLKVSAEGRDALLAMEFDFAVLEPTGVYSRIWRHWLRQAGREYRLVSHKALSHYRNGWQLQKTDKLDGLAMAMYGIERCNRASMWLSESDYTLSDLVLYHNHLNRQKNGFINNLRQKISWQIPEWYKKNVKREFGVNRIPGILKAITGNPSKKWQIELDESIGIGLNPEAASLARILITIEEEEIMIEKLIIEQLQKPEYAPYIDACNTCSFSQWLSATYISCIYPFEQFLEEGRPRIIHTYTKEKGKRVRKDESLRAFKLACGVGLVWYQSGDFAGWVAGGSGETRVALHNAISGAYLNYKKDLKQGKKVDPGELILIKNKYDKQGIMKVARHWTERLYKELYSKFC